MAATRPAKQVAFLEAVRKGNTRRGAAALAQVHHTTFYRWLENQTFRTALMLAEAEAESEMVQVVRRAAPLDWKAAQWYLEHYPACKQDWKRVNEIVWRDIPTETLLDLAARVYGGLESGVEPEEGQFAALGEPSE